MSPDSASSPLTTSLAPWLSVSGGARAVEFYQSAFGAVEVFRLEDPDGGVAARLSIDGAEFWLSDKSPPNGNFSPLTLGGATARMILTVADPDAAFARALTAGATEVHPVTDEYGWRLGPARRSLRAPLGNRASHLITIPSSPPGRSQLDCPVNSPPPVQAVRACDAPPRRYPPAGSARKARPTPHRRQTRPARPRWITRRCLPGSMRRSKPPSAG